MKLSIFILMLLMRPTNEVHMAGFWTHYQDTLIITNDKHYYTNTEAVFYKCGPSGDIKCEGGRNMNGCLQGSCNEAIPMQLRQTDAIDTLFLITTNAWIPYTRTPFEDPKPKMDSTLKLW
jgi:hypothetical protein